MEDYIKNKKVTNFVWNTVTIFIKEDFVNSEAKISEILDIIEERIPTRFLHTLDSIYVGNFSFLEERDLQAMYKDSSIYLSNKQSSSLDAADDVIHEIAHSLEQEHGYLIYADGSLEEEFLERRKSLWFILRSENQIEYETLSDFLNPDYDKNFDNFLYQEIGYPMLAVASSNLFYSPYGATSLREYFANGFEAFFFHRDVERLRATSPNLYKKITAILEQGEELNYEYNGKDR